MNPDQKQVKPYSMLWFLLNADELYTLTRFAYFAFLQNVAFRTAHHTLEYYMKAGLADLIPLEELKRLGHNLSKLHRRFCQVVRPIPVSEEEIDYLDHFDELRYPRDKSFTHIGWGLPLNEFFCQFEPGLREQLACFCMTDIDRIAHGIRSAIVPADQFKLIVVTREHATFLYRENRYFKQKISH